MKPKDKIKCEDTFGAIKAILIQPISSFPKGYSDEKHLIEADPFLQIGDLMTSKAQDIIRFGKEITYIKLIDDETKST